MGLKLNKEIGWIVSHAWSFRFLVLAAALTGAEALLPLFTEHPPLPRRLFAAVTFLVVVFAMVSRMVVQQRPPQFFIEPDPDKTPATPSDTTALNAATVQLCTATTLVNCATVQANGQ